MSSRIGSDSPGGSGKNTSSSVISMIRPKSVLKLAGQTPTRTSSSRDNDDSASLASNSSRTLAAVPEGPVYNAIFVGQPESSTARGSALISYLQGDWWLELNNVVANNVSTEIGESIFLALCKKRSPKKIPSMQYCCILPWPTTPGGNLPTTQLTTTGLPLTQIPLADVIVAREVDSAAPGLPLQRTKSVAKLNVAKVTAMAAAIDPRKFSSLVIIRPGASEEGQPDYVPTIIFAYANFVASGSDDKSAALADKIRRTSLAIADFSKDATAPITLKGKSYQDMDIVARDAFALLGKTKRDGELTFAEFKMVLATLNVSFTEPRAYAWFDLADNDGSGAIEFEEFQHLLYLVSKAEEPGWLSLRDVYFFFTNDRAMKGVEDRALTDEGDKGGEGAKEGEGDTPKPGQEKAEAAQKLKEEMAKKAAALFKSKDADENLPGALRKALPGVEVPTLHAVLNSFPEIAGQTNAGLMSGLMTSGKARKKEETGLTYKRAEQLWMTQQIRHGKSVITYEQVLDIWVGIVDPRLELGKRGLSAAKLFASGKILGIDKGSLRSFLYELVLKEDEYIIADLSRAYEASAAALKDVAGERERAKRQAEVKDEGAGLQRDDKDVKRRKALVEREKRLTAKREEEAASARAATEAALRAQMEAAIIARQQAEEALAEQQQGEDKASEADRRKRLGLDRVDLSRRSMTYLPAMLWNTPEGRQRLAELVILDLSGNLLRDVPSRNLFGNCMALQKLDLSGNALEQLPENIGDVGGTLKLLHLHQNQLRELPATIGKLKLLQKITLQGNQLTTLPVAFTQCSSLEVLHLQANNLTDLPLSFGKLAALKELNLAGNQLHFLPESIGACSLLEKLDVRNNGLREFPATLGRLKRLQAIAASHNVLREIPPQIGTCKRLMLLDVSRNRLRALPASIGKLTRLIALLACDNEILSLDPLCLEGLGRVQTLDLSKNRLTVLPPTIGRMLELQALNVSVNTLPTLPAEIGSCRMLRHMDLHSNCLGAHWPAGDYALPPSCATLISLEWLDLSRNGAKGVHPGLSACPRLQHLNLSDNAMEAYPAELAAMPQLLTLDLSNNRLKHVSPAIGRCARLRALDLSCNALERIPEAIGDCASLKHLHLYSNRMAVLPPSIAWLLPQLLSFDVGRNPLSGLPQKWSTAEVPGARDVLGLRFARERREPLLVELRRARARDLFRRLHGLRAKAEDTVDRERMSMLLEDTRLRRKGPAAVVKELAAFASRSGWSRQVRGGEKDRLDEWLGFIRGEVVQLEAEAASEVEVERRRAQALEDAAFDYQLVAQQAAWAGAQTVMGGDGQQAEEELLSDDGHGEPPGSADSSGIRWSRRPGSQGTARGASSPPPSSSPRRAAARPNTASPPLGESRDGQSRGRVTWGDAQGPDRPSTSGGDSASRPGTASSSGRPRSRGRAQSPLIKPSTAESQRREEEQVRRGGGPKWKRALLAKREGVDIVPMEAQPLSEGQVEQYAQVIMAAGGTAELPPEDWKPQGNNFGPFFRRGSAVSEDSAGSDVIGLLRSTATGGAEGEGGTGRPARSTLHLQEEEEGEGSRSVLLLPGDGSEVFMDHSQGALVAGGEASTSSSLFLGRVGGGGSGSTSRADARHRQLYEQRQAALAASKAKAAKAAAKAQRDLERRRAVKAAKLAGASTAVIASLMAQGQEEEEEEEEEEQGEEKGGQGHPGHGASTALTASTTSSLPHAGPGSSASHLSLPEDAEGVAAALAGKPSVPVGSEGQAEEEEEEDRQWAARMHTRRAEGAHGPGRHPAPSHSTSPTLAPASALGQQEEGGGGHPHPHTHHRSKGELKVERFGHAEDGYRRRGDPLPEQEGEDRGQGAQGEEHMLADPTASSPAPARAAARGRRASQGRKAADTGPQEVVSAAEVGSVQAEARMIGSEEPAPGADGLAMSFVPVFMHSSAVAAAEEDEAKARALAADPTLIKEAIADVLSSGKKDRRRRASVSAAESFLAGNGLPTLPEPEDEEGGAPDALGWAAGDANTMNALSTEMVKAARRRQLLRLLGREPTEEEVVSGAGYLPPLHDELAGRAGGAGAWRPGAKDAGPLGGLFNGVAGSGMGGTEYRRQGMGMDGDITGVGVAASSSLASAPKGHGVHTLYKAKGRRGRRASAGVGKLERDRRVAELLAAGKEIPWRLLSPEEQSSWLAQASGSRVAAEALYRSSKDLPVEEEGSKELGDDDEGWLDWEEGEGEAAEEKGEREQRAGSGGAGGGGAGGGGGGGPGSRGEPVMDAPAVAATDIFTPEERAALHAKLKRDITDAIPLSGRALAPGEEEEEDGLGGGTAGEAGKDGGQAILRNRALAANVKTLMPDEVRGDRAAASLMAQTEAEVLAEVEAKVAADNRDRDDQDDVLRVVGAATGANVRRLRALQKLTDARNDPEGIRAAQAEATLARARADKEAHIAAMKEAWEKGVKEKEAKAAEEERARREKEGTAIPHEALVLGLSSTGPGGSSLSASIRSDGLPVDIHPRSVGLAESLTSGPALGAYEELVQSGVLSNLSAARAEQYRRVGDVVQQGAARGKEAAAQAATAGLQDVHKSPLKGLGPPTYSLGSAAATTLSAPDGSSGGSTARAALDAMFSRAKATLEATRKGTGHMGMVDKYGGSAPPAVIDAVPGDPTPSSMFDPRRDPATVLRPDSYSQDYAILAAPSVGVRTQMPSFGQGLFTGLFNKDPYAKPDTVRPHATPSALDPPSAHAGRGGMNPGAAADALSTLPGPEEVTGISLRPTVRGAEAPASEGVRERRMLQTKRLVTAARDVRLYRYLGGVQFTTLPLDVEEAMMEEQAARANHAHGSSIMYEYGSEHDVSSIPSVVDAKRVVVSRGAGEGQGHRLGRRNSATGRTLAAATAAHAEYSDAYATGRATAPRPRSAEPGEEGSAQLRYRAFTPGPGGRMDMTAGVFIDANGRLVEEPPHMPIAVIRANNPFLSSAESTGAGSAGAVRSREQLLSVLLDKGDHNRRPGPSERHAPSGYMRGYTSGDVAEFLRLESVYAPYAEAEWYARAGAYLEGRASAADFVKAVRRRMQGRDPLTGSLLPDGTGHVAQGTDEGTSDEVDSRHGAWDPLLVPLVRRFFSVAYRTGLPPLYGSPTPEQAAARAELQNVVSRYRSLKHSRVKKSLQEQWAAYESLFALPPSFLTDIQGELARREEEQRARGEATKKSKWNMYVSGLQMDVRGKAERQHAAGEAARRAKAEEQAKEFRPLLAQVKQAVAEREAKEEAAARASNLNPTLALTKRARLTLQAIKLAGGSNILEAHALSQA